MVVEANKQAGTCAGTRRVGWAVAAVVAIALSVVGSTSVASARPTTTPAPGPLPYARLAADWWVWALGTPAASNPLIDETGANCSVGQRPGRPWFLAGGFADVERTCTLPAGRQLFFPAVNTISAPSLDQTGPSRSVIAQRLEANCGDDASYAVTIDGAAVSAVAERSVPFSLRLPVDNTFGFTTAELPNLMLTPSVDQGYYVLTGPIAAGRHELVVRTRVDSPVCPADFTVIYHLIAV